MVTPMLKVQSKVAVEIGTRWGMFIFVFFTTESCHQQWLEEYDEVWEKRVRLGKGAATREPDKVLIAPQLLDKVLFQSTPDNFRRYSPRRWHAWSCLPCHQPKPRSFSSRQVFLLMTSFLIIVYLMFILDSSSRRDCSWRYAPSENYRGISRNLWFGKGYWSMWCSTTGRCSWCVQVLCLFDVSITLWLRSSFLHVSRNREEMMGAGSAAAGSAAEDEPGWEYHVGSMGRCVVSSWLCKIYDSNRFAARFKGHFLICKWLNGSSRYGNRSSIDWCSNLDSFIFLQGFFNPSEIFLRRVGDRLFVSSRSTDLSSFFEWPTLNLICMKCGVCFMIVGCAVKLFPLHCTNEIRWMRHHIVMWCMGFRCFAGLKIEFVYVSICCIREFVSFSLKSDHISSVCGCILRPLLPPLASFKPILQQNFNSFLNDWSLL